MNLSVPVDDDRYNGLAELCGKPLYTSLWVRAWREKYPVEVQPYSSCTWELLGQLVDLLQLSPGAVLADLGCGAGGAGLWLARHLKTRLIGVDRSAAAIEIATQRLPDWNLSEAAAFMVGDFGATGIESASVDAAFSIDALPFAKDVDAALAEVHRILKPDGRLLFTTRELTPHTARYENLGGAWEIALLRNGFDVERIISRPAVSDLWRAIYDEWLAHEHALRAELRDELVDGLIAEANEVGPRLYENRRWLLISARRTQRR